MTMNIFGYRSVLYDAVLSVALEHKNNIAIECVTGEKITYIDLVYKIDICANNLHLIGINHGESIALVLKNSIEYASLIIACAKLGISYYPILNNFDNEYIEKSIKIINPIAIITDLSRDIPSTTVRKIEIRNIFNESDTYDSDNKNDVIHSGIFRMLWSSGSTGFPKIIIWNQEKFLFERLRWNRNVGVNAKDVIFCRHSLDVAHATDLHLFTSLLSGAKMILCMGNESTREIMHYIKKYNPTMMSALPSHYKELADFNKGENISSIKMPFCGGSYINLEMMHYVHKRTGLKLRQLYGSTDFGLAMANLDEECHIDIGMTLLNGVSAELMPISGLPEHTGELILESPFTSDGYLNNDVANINTFIGDFYHSGDIARKRKDGKYIILGRENDLLLTSNGPKFLSEIDLEFSDESKGIFIFTYNDQGKKNRRHVLIALYNNSNLSNEYAINKVITELDSWNVTYEIKYLSEIPRTPVGKVDKPKMFY